MYSESTKREDHPHPRSGSVQRVGADRFGMDCSTRSVRKASPNTVQRLVGRRKPAGQMLDEVGAHPLPGRRSRPGNDKAHWRG